jgi:integrase/recombinase XerD
LRLESHQVFDLLDYLNDTRKQIMQRRKLPTATQEFFLQLGEGKSRSNMMSMLLQHLKKMNSKVKTLEQLRAWVITHWLKQHHLRKVQVMAGHRHISTTESYKIGNLEDLKEGIKN